MARARRLALELLEDRCLLTTITEYPIAMTGSFPFQIASGPDGNLWFADQNSNQVGRMATDGTFLNEFPALSPSTLVEGLAAGPDGNMWAAQAWNGNGPQTYQISRITPTGDVTSYATSASVETITAGPDGKMWFTEHSGQIGSIDPADGTLVEYPNTATAIDLNSHQATIGPDGALWFTEYGAHKVGRFDLTTHTVSEINIGSTVDGPLGLAAGVDGGIWYTTPTSICRINPATRQVVGSYPIPDGGAMPEQIIAGADGNLWFNSNYERYGSAMATARQVGQITPTGTITDFPVPTDGGDLNGIIDGPDGNVWFTDMQGQLGMATLPGSDVKVTVQPLIPTAWTGDTAGFAITIKNLGPSLAKGIAFTDTLPAGFTFSSLGISGAAGSPSYTNTSGVLTSALGDLAPGGTITLQLRGVADQAGTLTDTASITTRSLQTVPADNTGSGSVNVQQSNLQIVNASVSPSISALGGSLTYTIVVVNHGTTPATGVQLTDALPSGLTFVSGTPLRSGNYGTYLSGGIVVSDLGVIDAGGNAEVQIVAYAAQAGTYNNPVHLTSVEQGGASAAIPTSVSDKTANLAVTIVPPSDPVGIKTPVTYTIQVKNDGPDAAIASKLTDFLPTGLQLVSAAVAGTTVPVTPAADGSLVFDLGDIASGATVPVTVQVTAPQPGSFTTQAKGSTLSAEADPSNDSASVTTTVTVGTDLSLQINATPEPATTGDLLDYTIPVANFGHDAARNVVVRFTLPANVTFLSADPAWDGSSFGTQFTNGVVTARLGTLDSNATLNVKVHVRVADPTGAPLVATATATADNAIDDNATHTTVVQGQGSTIVETMTPSRTSVPIGGALEYDIAVTNQGPDVATGVQVLDQLPSSLTYVGGDPAYTGTFGTSVDPATGLVTSKFGTMTVGETLHAKILVRVNPSAQPSPPLLGNRADVTATSRLLNTPSETVGVTVTPAEAQLVLTGAAAWPSVRVKDIERFTWTLTNNGSVPATSPTVTVDLPAGFKYGSTDFFYNDGTSSVSGNRVTLHLKDLPDAGASRTFSIEGFPQEATAPTRPLTLTAVATATQPIAGVPAGATGLTATATAKVTDGTVALGLTGTTSSSQIIAGTGKTTLSWTVSNLSGLTARGLTARIALAPGMAQTLGTGVVGAEGGVTTSGLPQDGQILSFDLPDLPGRKSETFSLIVNSYDVGANTVTAGVNSSDDILGGGPIASTVSLLVHSSSSAFHELTNPLNNKVLDHVSIDTIFYGSQWGNNNSAYHLKDMGANIGAFLKTIVSGPYMDFLGQYGVGTGSVHDGEIYQTTPGSDINDLTIQTMIASQILNGRLPNDPERLYIVFTPPGSTVSEFGIPPQNSINDFLGYHDESTIPFVPFHYAVIPFQAGLNGGITGLDPFRSTTVVLSHEIAEAVTDPSTNFLWELSWTDPKIHDLNEIGDLAANKPLHQEEGDLNDYGMLDGYAVQYEFANKYTYPGTNITVNHDAALPSRALDKTVQFQRILPPQSGGEIHTSSLRAAAASGFSFSGPIATFTDTLHPQSDTSLYRVSIDWGDGSTSPGTVAYNAALGEFVVSASHTFAQAAGSTASITVRLTDTATGDVASMIDTVPLQTATAPPAEIAFDAPTYTVNRNGSDAVFTVRRTGDTSLEATVAYRITGGTAAAGVDYQTEAGTLVFLPGQTVQVFTIPIYADPGVSIAQTMNLSLVFPTGNAILGTQATAVLTINPSDRIFAPAPPTLADTSDTGWTATDGITRADGSASSPLVFLVHNLPVTGGFAQFYDVTDPAHPVILGSPAQAVGGTASITLSSKLAAGLHRIAVGAGASASSIDSPMSDPFTLMIDAAAPTSVVRPLPATSPASGFTVKWSGQDNRGGSGLAGFNVYVSDNGGPFVPFLLGTTATSAVFHGTAGHTYSFSSVAIDTAGNTGAIVSRGQAHTLVASAGLAIQGAASATVGTPYTLTLPTTAAGMSILGWSIHWGDGTVQTLTGAPARAVHDYAKAGTFAITATVTTSAGAEKAVGLSVTVHPATSGQGTASTVFVSTLYNDILGRAPESSGLSFWAHRATSNGGRVRVGRALFGSKERHLLALQGRAPRITLGHSLADAARAAAGVGHPAGTLALHGKTRAHAIPTKGKGH